MTGPRDGGHGDWDALAVGWALSTLDAEDEAAFAVHLPGCEQCAAVVRESLHTVADLAYALPDESPPPALKDRLMAAVRAEPRAAAVPAAGSAPDWFDQPGPRPAPAAEEPGRVDHRPGRHAARDDEGRTVVPFQRPAARRRWTQVAAAAAVLVLLGALGAWNLRLRADRDDLRELAARRDATIQQLTTNGPARVAALTADGRPNASRRATVVVRGSQVEIITEGLGVTSGETTYWLWTLRCDTAAPTDLKPIRGFTIPEDQFSVRDIGSDPGFSTATCFAISEEPGPATPTAPTEVVAVGRPE